MLTPLRNPDFIYKVASAAAFGQSEAAGSFVGMPVDHADGYVHFSTAAQLRETLRLHFAGQADLVLFAVRARDVGAALRWEASRGGDLFPHVYGDVPMRAVAEHARIAVAADGAVDLPEWVQ